MNLDQKAQAKEEGLFHRLKRGSAAARAFGIGVGELEATADQSILEAQSEAGQIGHRSPVNHHRDFSRYEDSIIVGLVIDEVHGI